jgi:hypothetical protein
MHETSQTFIERRFLKEIAEIDAQIAELQSNKRALERLLLKARRENLSTLGGATRRNSMGRVLVEHAIVEALRAAPKPLSNKALLAAARATDYDLKEVTLRSYLHRMKGRGLIKNPRGQTGRWQISAPAPNPDTRDLQRFADQG